MTDIFYTSAASIGHTELVKRLLQDTEFTIFLNSEQGSSAFHFAAWNGHFEIVQHLLELGLSANTNSKDNLSALHLASLNGHLKTLTHPQLLP